MPEILSGVHQIFVNYSNRPLKLYLLLGSGASLLMDTGDAAVPEKDILPYFKSIGFDPGQLTYIMITHPDVDHQGGLARMKRAAPQARVICGTVDREQIESPETLIELRYRAFMQRHGIGPDDAAKAKLLPRCGAYVPVDLTFSGGEQLFLGSAFVLDILHLPGHSHGHLGVYLPAHRAAIIADAVHGTANRFIDGRAAFAATYMYIDEYIGTIDALAAMHLQKVFSCHWADCLTTDAVQAWLTESRDYCLRAQQAIAEVIKEAPGGLTLKEVMAAAKPHLGDWPAERDGETRSMAAGHVAKMVAQGLVAESAETPVRFTWKPAVRGT
jgi:glyoxylase-like metal-dependent hydrolase (beta-lactamase superfamily II)